MCDELLNKLQLAQYNFSISYILAAIMQQLDISHMNLLVGVAQDLSSDQSMTKTPSCIVTVLASFLFIL